MNNDSVMPRMLSETNPDLVEFRRQLAIIQSYISRIEKEVKNKKVDPCFYNIKDLSKKLHLSIRTIAEYKQKGFLPYVKIGGSLLFPVEEINKLLSSRKDKNQ